MASFTTRIKDEITKIETNRLESIAEVCAYLKDNSEFRNNEIIMFIENASVARRMFSLIKRIYGINIKLTIRTQKKFVNKTMYILELKEKVDIITSDVENMFRNIKDYSEEEKMSYLKGIFLSCGSINDPSTSKYHLELLVRTKEVSDLVMELLKEFNFNSKLITRNKGYMVYIKSSEEISDFIKMLNAIDALFYYEDIRIYRDHKNMVNRLNNCEQANVEKMMKTCNEQVENIEFLEKEDLLNLLDDKTKTIAEYRLKYPETTMQELANIISMETEFTISKSGINHGFRKIKDFVNKAKNNEGE